MDLVIALAQNSSSSSKLHNTLCVLFSLAHAGYIRQWYQSDFHAKSLVLLHIQTLLVCLQRRCARSRLILSKQQLSSHSTVTTDAF